MQTCVGTARDRTYMVRIQGKLAKPIIYYLVVLVRIHTCFSSDISSILLIDDVHRKWCIRRALAIYIVRTAKIGWLSVTVSSDDPYLRRPKLTRDKRHLGAESEKYE